MDSLLGWLLIIGVFIAGWICGLATYGGLMVAAQLMGHL